MKYYRLRFSEEASTRLGQLKGKTGLTPNILSRIGFMMSLPTRLSQTPKTFQVMVIGKLIDMCLQENGILYL